MKILKHTIVLLLITVLIFPYSVTAGWLDDWFDQHVSSGPNYFEGQKRGYFTAGSFSARIPSSTDYLISIEKPRIKAGCGGIDIFMGGFGFVNFDYLVQKLQRLIQAAPMVAFDIALNTLSPQLSQTIKEAEKIIDALNNLQLNECSILKPFTTISLREDAKRGSPEAQFVEASNAALKNMGLTDLFAALGIGGQKSQNVENKSGNNTPPEKLWEGCSPSLQGFINSVKNGGSGLQYIVETYGRNSNFNLDELVPYIRGIAGDITMIGGSGETSFSIAATKPCPESTFTSIREGALYRKDSPADNAPCQQEPGALSKKTADILLRAKRAKEGKWAMPNEYENLVKTSPVPVEMLLNYSIATKDESLIPVIADPVSKAFFYMALTEVYAQVYDIKNTLDKLASQTAGGNPDSQCAIPEKLIPAVEEFGNRLWNAVVQTKDAYIASVGDVSSIANMASLYQKFYDKVFEELSHKFGPSVAKRALGGK